MHIGQPFVVSSTIVCTYYRGVVTISYMYIYKCAWLKHTDKNGQMYAIERENKLRKKKEIERERDVKKNHNIGTHSPWIYMYFYWGKKINWLVVCGCWCLLICWVNERYCRFGFAKYVSLEMIFFLQLCLCFSFFSGCSSNDEDVPFTNVYSNRFVA